MEFMMRTFTYLFWLIFITCGTALGQTLTNNDVGKMHQTYEANQARFKRDYVGKIFTARLPLFSVTEDMFFKNSYRIGLGNLSSFTSEVDCLVSDRATVDKIMNWDKGNMITITGTVSDHIMGSIILEKCQVSRN